MPHSPDWHIVDNDFVKRNHGIPTPARVREGKARATRAPSVLFCMALACVSGGGAQSGRRTSRGAPTEALRTNAQIDAGPTALQPAVPDASLEHSPRVAAERWTASAITTTAFAADGGVTHSAPASPQHARITTSVRSIPKAPRGPATIRYPIVHLPNADSSRAINESVARVIDANYDADDDPQLVAGITFQVDYNAHGILAVTFRVSTEGMLPGEHVEHHAYVLATGMELLVGAIFDPARNDALVATLEAAREREVALVRAGRFSGIAPECKDTPFAGRFTAQDLRSFRVGSKGITFAFDYPLPNATRQCVPPGKFFLSYPEVVRFLLPDGPLVAVARAYVGGGVVPDSGAPARP